MWHRNSSQPPPSGTSYCRHPSNTQDIRDEPCQYACLSTCLARRNGQVIDGDVNTPFPCLLTAPK
jgi:hypothetical protein